MYASRTKVESTHTRSEIEHLLNKKGATGFIFGQSGEAAMLVFELQAYRLKFILPMPKAARTKESERRIAQEIRRRWRALLLVLKAKLEAVESGIITFQEEFLAHIVIAGNSTIGEHVIPGLGQTIESGKLPPLLTAGS